jgi:hypothetical protein
MGEGFMCVHTWNSPLNLQLVYLKNFKLIPDTSYLEFIKWKK